MSVQVIMRDGVPEYAVLPWDEYQALLSACGQGPAATAAPEASAALPRFSELRAMREARGMALDALARAVGISPSYLDLIESGDRDPGEAIRRSLARAMEIDGWAQEI
ncbi:helix-turn-helix transcriptional regulator [Pseudomonas stutzeri]|uniref:helix-turn-helix domain-containing protein n=1 Tax=Stutzerimonas stutzeri TaxID=316 RepID=UPI001F51FB6C|nr:helix-turn-helix transcriptional regulator [Stutzerimonas stutzeri]MCI0919125.1 helix-turn-helix transcriptional regulator [Stutzerimonas stutzeri]